MQFYLVLSEHIIRGIDTGSEASSGTAACEFDNGAGMGCKAACFRVFVFCSLRVELSTPFSSGAGGRETCILQIKINFSIYSNVNASIIKYCYSLIRVFQASTKI